MFKAFFLAFFGLNCSLFSMNGINSNEKPLPKQVISHTPNFHNAQQEQHLGLIFNDASNLSEAGKIPTTQVKFHEKEMENIAYIQKNLNTPAKDWNIPFTISTGANMRFMGDKLCFYKGVSVSAQPVTIICESIEFKNFYFQGILTILPKDHTEIEQIMLQSVCPFGSVMGPLDFSKEPKNKSKEFHVLGANMHIVLKPRKS